MGLAPKWWPDDRQHRLCQATKSMRNNLRAILLLLTKAAHDVGNRTGIRPSVGRLPLQSNEKARADIRHSSGPASKGICNLRAKGVTGKSHSLLNGAMGFAFAL
jgi:hypothetical protein